MATQIEPSDVLLVRNQIIVDGQVAFTAGERVVVEAVQPNQTRPQYKYVVYSVTLGKRFQLSDRDISLSPSGESGADVEAQGKRREKFPVEQAGFEDSDDLQKNPENGKESSSDARMVRTLHESDHEASRMDEDLPHPDKRTSLDGFPAQADKTAVSTSAVLEHDCMHQYERVPDGSLTCRKCGMNITSTGEALPNVPKYCGECGEAVGAKSLVCGMCGAPNEALIERNASMAGVRHGKCKHEWRYVNKARLCIKCATSIPLRNTAERRLYMRALGDEICINCGEDRIAGHEYCQKCGKPYESLQQLVPGKKIFSPCEARLLQRKSGINRTGSSAHPGQPAYQYQDSSYAPSPTVLHAQAWPSAQAPVATSASADSAKATFCCICGKLTEDQIYCDDCAPGLSS